MTLIVFCYLNDKQLDVDPIALYEVACKVADSSSKNKDPILLELKELIEKNLKHAFFTNL